ncbi:derlin-1 [Exaiptasia diaphana]|uniref:Derlin n=1 Tax=Exaiptasia diaphana TaxID=2652724 RepID=A0A913X7H9_EXADI|nr:derlin-1 [Exaiptasia diaphana]KXJ26931.1 Derlin-1 [Exaiptasia diaphana]
MAAENDIGDWFRGIPIITRYWFSLSIIFPLLGRIGLINAYYMLLDFGLVIYNFQIWRLLTCFVYYPISPQTGFHYLINLYFLYSYSTRLESGLFDGRPADFLFMLLFNGLVLIIIGFAATLRLLMDPLVLSVLYVWCQVNKETIVQFWFGMQFKAMYLPWVLAIFNMIIQGGGVMELIGIFVGHVYFFLMFKYPQDFGGARLISTPSFFYKYLPNRQGGVSGFGIAPSSRRPRDDGNDGGGGWGRNWGRGRRLDE